MKSKKKLIFVAIIVIILLVLFPLFLRDGKRGNILPEMTFSDDDNRKDNKADSATIDYVGGFRVVDGTHPENLSFHNDSKNECNFVVRIFLSDGTLLYESDEIEPGDNEQVTTLLSRLEQGTYEDAILCYDCYDKTSNPVGRCEFTIRIMSL